MITNCVNRGAPIDRKLNKCPYCDTPYGYSDFNASFENKSALGIIRISGKVYQVYLGERAVSTIDMASYVDMNGTLHRGKAVSK